ncbi:MAG TPA: hypothetical protein VIJ40_10490 [Acidimicrobiales bacterium]
MVARVAALVLEEEAFVARRGLFVVRFVALGRTTVVVTSRRRLTA